MTMKFCMNCGAELNSISPVCEKCGVSSTEIVSNVSEVPVPPTPQIMITKFCSACGSGLVATAVVCPSCGTSQRSAGRIKTFVTPKSKTTAVVLAVFLSFWTWCYTYRKDPAKFWIGLGVSVFFSWMYFIPALGIWIWAIVDAAIKPDSFYEAD